MLHCPHCDLALRLSSDAPARQVHCPSCRQVFPHPNGGGQGDEPVLALAVEVEERLRQPSSRGSYWMLLLGVLGVFLTALFTVSRFALRLGDTVGSLSVVLLLSGIYGGGILLTGYARNDLARTAGWVIVLAFVALGGFTVVVLLLVLLADLVIRVVR